jgi:hypothetical protein
VLQLDVGVVDSCISALLDCTFSVERIVDGDVVILLPVVNNRSGVSSLRDAELLSDLLGVSASRSSSSPSLLFKGCTGEGCGIWHFVESHSYEILELCGEYAEYPTAVGRDGGKGGGPLYPYTGQGG